MADGKGGRRRMRKTCVMAGLLLCVAVLVTGCGPDYKKESEQLKAQMATLQKENINLKGEVTALKADAEAVKKQLADLIQEKQGLEEELKEAEAQAAVKPSGKPPLKSRKS
jgi:predicted nuclease with TOPRIM domain